MATRRNIPHSQIYAALQRIKAELGRNQVSLKYHAPGVMRLVGDMKTAGVNEHVRAQMEGYATHEQQSTAQSVYKMLEGDHRFREVREAVQDKEKGMQVHFFYTERAGKVLDTLYAFPEKGEMVLTPKIGDAKNACHLVRYALLTLIKLKNKRAPTSVRVKSNNNPTLVGCLRGIGFQHNNDGSCSYDYAEASAHASYLQKLVKDGKGTPKTKRQRIRRTWIR